LPAPRRFLLMMVKIYPGKFVGFDMCLYYLLVGKALVLAANTPQRFQY